MAGRQSLNQVEVEWFPTCRRCPHYPGHCEIPEKDTYMCALYIDLGGPMPLLSIIEAWRKFHYQGVEKGTITLAHLWNIEGMFLLLLHTDIKGAIKLGLKEGWLS